MVKENDNIQDVSGREMVISRLLDAPRKLVFEAWTDPDHLINWWGPSGFTNTFLEIAIKPGGVWRFIMHGPDGVNYPNRIVFKEVINPRLLTYTHSSGEPNDPGAFEVTITFEEKAAKTLLTMRAVFITAEERDKVVKEFGALEGAIQMMDRLELELENMK